MSDPPTGFHGVLNRHGYGFHYSVLRRADALYGERRSKWGFEVAEFPVEVRGQGTRIDFILKHRERPHYLVAECKRANPALADWCFVRAPYVRSNRTDERILAEHITRERDGSLRSGAKPIGYSADAYQIALEVRTDARGDSGGSGRGAIEEAATQISRGMNGLVEFFVRNRTVLKGIDEAVISPVIFTTANLWASGVDLSQADLPSGNVDPKAAGLIPKPYVMYQYHLSPGIKHEWPRFPLPRELGDILDTEYVRTVHIVSTSGIDSFLSFMSDLG